MPHQQPETSLTFTEYELQVLETITQHAIDAGAMRPDLVRVVAGVQRKVVAGRADLALARRRLAVQRASDMSDGGSDGDAGAA